VMAKGLAYSKAESGRLVNRTGFSGYSMFPKGASFGSLSEKPFQNCELVTPLPRMNVTIGVSNETSAGSMIPRDDLTGNAQTALLKKPRPVRATRTACRLYGQMDHRTLARSHDQPLSSEKEPPR
jgi:hypothetical protein